MPGPLEGVKVLSFAKALPRPYTTMLLCDLGAEVIKIEDLPMKFSRTPCKIEKACPNIGEQTVEVLSTLLGMSPAEIEDLRKEKVIEYKRKNMFYIQLYTYL